MRKNIVSEIQKIARELKNIPTDEAKILAELSKSVFSNENMNKSQQA